LPASIWPVFDQYLTSICSPLAPQSQDYEGLIARTLADTAAANAAAANAAAKL
jgi:hypothetical protein